jgi:membrane-associated HD superfamily phosphohydrolase
MACFCEKPREASDGNARERTDSEFRYPGSKPQSREAAIVMMADAVGAASGTHSEPTTAQVKGMFDRLVDDRVDDNQLDECDITLRDIKYMKQSFSKTLTGIFHHRIDYPGYDRRRVGENSM